jgi:1-acyl-sn-glycerol-3-phosphate acyltransferase
MGPAAAARLALRAPAAAIWLGAMFAAFLLARGLDRIVVALSGRPGLAVAPWVVLLWARGSLALLGLRRVTHGAPMRLPGAVVANHASWIDVVALQAASRVFFVSKAEVAGWPVIGAIGRAIGTVFIERRAAEARRQTEALHARLERGDRLAIFPEGTSSDGLRVLPFKSALFAALVAPELRARLWVQPASVVYRPAHGLPPAFYGWWGDMDFAKHLRMLLAHSRGGTVEITFHAPLRAADLPDRKALADAAAALVAAGHAAGSAEPAAAPVPNQPPAGQGVGARTPG